MDRTNANDFRTNLKEWMEAARNEPVKITRRSGEAFVLLNADIFEKMQLELARFKGLSGSLMDVIHGRVSPVTAKSTKEIFTRAKTRALNIAKKSKKASGD